MEPSPLGVQLHCLRHLVRQDLGLALEAVHSLGVSAVELNYFPGCRGNPWGDFGAAADLPASTIAGALRDGGLTCPSVMVNEADLAPTQCTATLDWIARTGAGSVMLTALRAPPERTLAAWQATLSRCLQYVQACAAHGLGFGLHTQPDLWHEFDGTRPLDVLPTILAGSSIALEYDPTGALLNGADPAELLQRWRGPLHAVHLRDGRKPTHPAPYLPALPLGEGDTDWPAFLEAARAARPAWYFLEMEVARPEDVMAALRSSLTCFMAVCPATGEAACPTPS